MPHAVIQGDVHTSRKDRDVLQERLSGVDAVMREGMQKTWHPGFRPFYLLLFIGAQVFRHTFQRILYASDEPVFSTATELDLSIHKLDISVVEWAERIPDMKKGFLAGFSAVMAYSMVTDHGTLWFQIVTFPILFVLLFFLFTAVLTIPERDDLMTDQVVSLTDEHDYDTVLVSVGDAHVPGIQHRLERQGWDVEAYMSQSLFGRILRPLTTLVRNVPS